MKRALVALLAFALAVTCTACTKELPVTSETTEIEDGAFEIEEGAVLTYWAEDAVTAEPLAEAFTELYGVEVSVETIGFDATSKLMLEGPAGNGGDVVWVKSTDVPELVNAGVVQAINEDIASNIEATVQTTAYEASVIDGELYGIPMSIESNALFYNKDIIDTPATTFEQILEEAKEYNDPTNNKFYLLISLTTYNFQAVFSAFDVELFADGGTNNDEATLDTDEMVAALEYIEVIQESMPITSTDLQIENYDFIEENFASGNTAYMISGPWSVTTLNESGVNYGVIPIPSINGSDAEPFLGITSNVVSSYSEYPVAAQLFAEFLASEEAGQINYETTGAISALKDTSSIEGLAEDEVMQAFVEQFETTSLQPTVSRMTYMWDTVNNVVNALYDGSIEPEEAAAKMQADFEALVASE